MTQSELLQFVNSYLRPQGFSKKDRSWYRDNPETTSVMTFEKSRWEDLYYVTLAIFFKELNSEKNPKFYKAHARIRAEDLGENTDEYLSLEKQMSEETRKVRLQTLLNTLIPLLSRMETMVGFKQLLKEYNPRLFMLSNDAQEYLGIKVE